MLNLIEPIRDQKTFIIFFSSLNLGFVSEKVFLSFWLKFFQNPADQTDPDPGPKHCNINYGFCIIIVYILIMNYLILEQEDKTKKNEGRCLGMQFTNHNYHLFLKFYQSSVIKEK